MKMIFATGNKGKADEVRMMLKDEGIALELETMDEAGIMLDIVEDGKTFMENAVKKAVTVMKYAGQAAMADDSGLEVDFLDKAPGIYSARFLGRKTPYSVKNQFIIDRLKGVDGDRRSARFVCAIAVAFTDGCVLKCDGTIEGIIADKPRGDNGFGYDPIFYVPKYAMTTGEMEPHFKNSISHRGVALRKMMSMLKESGRL